MAAVVGRNINIGASTSRAATAAPSTPVVAATSANPSSAAAPRPQPSRPAPSPAPRLTQALTSATDPARKDPLPKGSFVGSQGTLYNREAWMYKDPLCPVTLCDGYDSKARLSGSEGDIIRRELTLFNLCWRCRVSRDHRAEHCPKKDDDGVGPAPGRGKGKRKAAN